MRINQIKNAQNFNGLYNNKILLSSLEHIANHSASFAAGVSFLSAVALRPLAISMTPKADRENKKILSADSIASGFVKLFVALGISLPIESAVNKIKENQDQLFKNNSFKNLSKKQFDFLTQSIKLGSNLLSAIPKSIATVTLIPVIASLLNKQKEQEVHSLEKQGFETYKNSVSFKGDLATNLISSIIESEPAQNFAIKYSKNSKNIARNTSVATDILLTAGGVIATSSSKKIEENKKKPLIINKILSTAISILGGCAIDEIVQKLGKNFVENFKNANIDNPKLSKYLEGLNVARPTVIFALIYYGFIPIFTTLVSDKASKEKIINK